MRKIQTYLLGCLLFAAPLLQSCDDDTNDGYIYNGSLAVGDMVIYEGEQPYIKLDSKKSMLPSNISSIPSRYMENGKRVIINFTLLEENYMGYNYHVKINDIDTVLVKRIIPITPETADSIGNDVVNILDIWANKDYVTVQYETWGNPNDKHMVNLVHDPNQSNNPDNEGYLKLEFRYKNSQTGHSPVDRKYWDIVSFRLDRYLITGTGVKVKANTYQGEKIYKCDVESGTETTSNKTNSVIR